MLANIKSAIKRARQAQERRFRNVSTRSAIKTAIRRFEEALTAGDMTAAKAALRRTTILLDKAAAKGIIGVMRKKSRLAKRLAAADTAS